ncbi:MAG: hypothetical protein ACFE96_08850, partial [Candidatus Hermodarchaeota archaeon]
TSWFSVSAKYCTGISNLLVQIPFVITFVNIFRGIHYEIIEIITISFLALILLSLYFKIRLYVSSYYTKTLQRYDINELE